MLPRNPLTAILLFFCIFSIILIFFRYSTSDSALQNPYGFVFEDTPVTGEKVEEEEAENDELLDGKPILSYYRKLASKIDILSGRSDHGPIKILAAYKYSDHFSVALASQKRMGSTVYCRYLDDTNQDIHNPVETIIYPYFVAYCSWRNGTKGITVTNRQDDQIDERNVAPMINRRFKKPVHHLTYCLAPIYGDEPKWLHLVELIEHYRLQGVTRFFVYIRKISEYDLKLLKSYEASGEVEIIEIPATVSDVIAQQIMAVSDCHLRNRRFSKWTIFSDIDERFVMSDEPRIIDAFLRNISDDSIGSIAFPQRWIMKRAVLPPKFESDQQVSQRMPTREWHETTSAAIKGNPACSEQISCWAKDVIRNDKVIRMLVHEVDQFYPGATEWFLNDTVGYIRHYRDVHMQSWEEKNMRLLKKFGPFSNTTYPSSLSNQLYENVISRLHEVYKP